MKQNVSLKNYSNLKIGGNADYFYEFASEKEIVDVLSGWRDKYPEMDNIIVLGGGTNILFKDEGFRGLVIKNSIDFLTVKDEIVEVGGGTLLSKLVNFCINKSLSGFEWAGGLPGTVGGAIRGNAGAYGGEAKDNLVEVKVLGIKSLKIDIRNNSECKFGYRDSVFKKEEGKNEIILSAKFKFNKGDKEIIKSQTDERINKRKERHPLDFPNLGSTFKNVSLNKVSEDLKKEYKDSIKNDPFPIFPSTKLLSLANLKGKTIGGAKFSEKHPNFIVNFNNATASDVRDLIDFAKKQVKEKFNVSLEEEILVL